MVDKNMSSASVQSSSTSISRWSAIWQHDAFTRYRERVKAERGLRPPGEDEFRWMLEEFRVSLFAQQLGTRGTVSARRLGDAWVARERAS